MPDSIKSLIIVAFQFLVLIYLFLTGPVIAQNSFFLLLEGFGVFLALWALQTMRTSSVFNITPDVPKESALVTVGPYAHIRHPMYLSLLLIVFALILNYFTLLRLLAAVILIMDLVIKINLEEKFLEERFKGKYKSYKQNAFKLIPYIY